MWTSSTNVERGLVDGQAVGAGEANVSVEHSVEPVDVVRRQRSLEAGLGFVQIGVAVQVATVDMPDLGRSTRRSSARVSTASSPAGSEGVGRASYHHGNLKEALIADAIEVISERGVGGFSLAEASRRLGVAASAPYAHFADRAELFAAVSVRALQIFREELEPALARSDGAADRLAATARAYVQFAAAHQTLFQLLFSAEFGATLDKARHPEVAAAERPIEEAFLDSVKALAPATDNVAAGALAAAVEAIAHGHATLLLDGRFGGGSHTTARAATSAARATFALLDARERYLSPERARKSERAGAGTSPD